MFLNDFVEPQKLLEGLLKVPPVLRERCLHQASEYLLWMLRDRMTPDKRQRYPGLLDSIKQEASKAGVTLPRGKLKLPEHQLIVMGLPNNFSGLPASYLRLTPDRDAFFLVLNFGNPKTGANALGAFRADVSGQGVKRGIIQLNLCRLPRIERFPENPASDGVVGSYMRHIASVLDHELRHLVQTVLLRAVDPAQDSRLPDYKEHGDDYFLSGTERHPTLGSEVDDFMEHYALLKSYGKKIQIKTAIEQVVGMRPSAVSDGFYGAPFFKALRKHDPAAYRNSVVKFVKEVTLRLSEEVPSHEAKKKVRKK